MFVCIHACMYAALKLKSHIKHSKMKGIMTTRNGPEGSSAENMFYKLLRNKRGKAKKATSS